MVTVELRDLPIAAAQSLIEPSGDAVIAAIDSLSAPTGGFDNLQRNPDVVRDIHPHLIITSVSFVHPLVFDIFVKLWRPPKYARLLRC